jgi:hypothetical protein
MRLISRTILYAFAGLLPAIVVFAAALPANAAKFSKRDYAATNDPSALDFEPRCNIQMTGEIVGPDPKVGQVGDYERAKIALATFQSDPRRLVAAGDKPSALRPASGFFALCLSSEGGDLREALRIATLFQDHWMTVVEEGHACLSACAVLFMQAKRRDGVFSGMLNPTHPGRFMHNAAELGFHAPALIYPAEAGATVAKEEAQQAYKEALASVEALLPNDWQISNVNSAPFGDERDMLRYQRVMGLMARGQIRSEDEFPTKLLVRMLTTPNSDLLKIKTLGEAQEYGIGVFGLPVPKHLTDRMIVSACAAAVHTRCQNTTPRGQCLGQFDLDSAQVARPNLTAAQRKALSTIPDLFSKSNDVVDGLLGLDRELDTAVGPIERQQAMLKRWRVERTMLWPLAKAQGGLNAEAVAVRNIGGLGSATIPCAVVGHWDGDLLVDLELQTRNGIPRHFLIPVSDHVEFMLKVSQQMTMSHNERLKLIQRLEDRAIDLDMAKKHLKDNAELIADLKKFAAKSTDVKLNIAVQDSMGVAEARKELDAILARPETESRLAWYKMLPLTTPLKDISGDVWSWYEQGNAIGPPLRGVAARKVASVALAVPPVGTEAGVGQPATKLASSMPSETSTSAQRSAAEAFNIKGWTRKVEASSVILTSPPIAGKVGVTLEFWTLENAVDKGGMEPWFKDRIDRWLGGRTIYKRQGLMRKGPALWIDAVSLPNAQKKGGTVFVFNAWQARTGAQFVVQMLPEHVRDDDPAAFESDALLSTLSAQGVELTPGIVRAVQQKK